ncbi:sulfotransferase [Aestuariivirga sp.]|uniref:sulfotransferase n=1 Tax=Aestuariivirga sp. TaxID=2650926 RepID=UPI003BA8EFC2
MTVKSHFFPLHLLARSAMQRAGVKGRRPKLFFIGFNKTGTKTLHNFFCDNGYLSVHSSSYMAQRLKLPPIAKLMQANHEAGLPLLHHLDHYDVFSDMIFLSNTEVIEGNGWFRELHAQHPDAYFIFNDRPVEKWVLSRLSHDGGPRGSFVARYASAMKIDESQAPDLWRAHYARHKAEVMAHFEAYPRFMIFQIESGKPQDLVRFLAPDYRLDASFWSLSGSRAQRHRNMRS